MEKKAYNRTWAWMVFALVPILVMTIGRTAFSWSQNHSEKYDFLLYPALIGISMVFRLRAFYHSRREEILFKLLWPIKHRYWNEFVSWAFIIVLCFGVNSELWWVHKMHIYSTAIAIVSAHVSMLFYYDRGVALHGAILGSSIGLVGFLFMYLFPVFTTAEAELWTAFPLIIWIVFSTKREL